MEETGGRRATCLEKCAGVPGAGVPGAAASWKDDMASVTPSSPVLVKAEPTITRILLRRVPGPLQPPRLIQVGTLLLQGHGQVPWGQNMRVQRMPARL